MNYHTFELSFKLTRWEFDYFKTILSKKKFYRDKKEEVPTWVYEALRKHGIIIRIRKFSIKDYSHYLLYYRINPRRVMDEHNYIGLFNAAKTESMLHKVNEYIKSIDESLPSVDDCKINRIDFCMNVEMSGQDEIFKYIKILQRGYLYNKYYLWTEYNEKSKRYKPRKDSCDIIKPKALKISYYNKFEQLKENKYCRNIKEAENILRIEIQCDKKKVRYLSDKFGCTQVRTFLECSDIIGNDVFKNYANKFYGDGDFYKLSEIHKRIDESACHKKSKKMMRELADMSAKHKSLNTAINRLCWDKRTINKVMKLFDKIGVSPVVIPRRSEYDTFINPLTLALESYDNQ